MKTFKDKIKKYSFWTGLSAAVVMLCNAIAKCFGFSINDQMIEDVIMSICGVLVAFGVVCMPIKNETQTSQEEQTIDENTNLTNDEEQQEQLQNVLQNENKENVAEDKNINE